MPYEDATTVDLGYCVTKGTREICMLYPKIRYKRGKLVVNVSSGTCCLIRYMRQNAISEGVIAEVHCIDRIINNVYYAVGMKISLRNWWEIIWMRLLYQELNVII